MRPVARYPGSKNREARNIIALMPPHKVYVEPFCGVAGVFMSKKRARSEILNDLSGDVLNLLRVLADEETAAELADAVRATPYSRQIHSEAWKMFAGGGTAEPVGRALNFLVRGAMSHAGKGLLKNPGFDARVNRDGFMGRVNYWRDYPDFAGAFTTRLRGVVLECLEASRVIDLYDGPETLFYLDPPYTPGEWSGGVYEHEMDASAHAALCKRILNVEGHCLLSGYDNAIYRELLEGRGWAKQCKEVRTEGSKKRECVWLSPSVAGWLERERLKSRLF